MVVEPKKKALTYYDSCGGSSKKYFEQIKSLIVLEHVKINKDEDINDWAEIVPTDAPKQQNGSDCGIFVMAAAEFLSRGHPLDYDQSQINGFRQRFSDELSKCELLPVWKDDVKKEG